ncbi:MAG: hypothetical protein M3O46_01055 [Myxococcota bacterium]|nr:hypothetical protein [Myxococcota bacterium]
MTPFDERMLHILARRGITQDSDGHFDRSPTYTGPRSPTDDELRYMNESLPQFDTNACLVRQWVQNLAQVVETLAREGDGAEWAYVAVFWVRLHGLLSELRSQYTGFLRLPKIDPVTQGAPPASQPACAHALDVALHRARLSGVQRR